MGSKNRRAKAARAALVANSDTSKLPVWWEVTNTKHLGVEYGSTSTPAPSTEMLHVALAEHDYSLPAAPLLPATSVTSTTAAPAQAQALHEIEPALLWEIRASARRRGHEVGLKEGQRVGFREGMEAGMKKGMEQGHKEGHREGRFRGFRDGYQAGQLEVSQALCAPSCPQIAIANPACDATPTSIFAVDAVDVLEDTAIVRSALQTAAPTSAFMSPTPTATIRDIAAVPLPTSTSPASALAITVALADSPAARDSRNLTPAPTQQPHEANTSNVRSAPSASSIATHTASASSGDEPASLSHPTRTFATAREPDALPATIKRESREVRSVNTHPALPIASRTASASPDTAATSPSNTAPPFAIAREPEAPPTAPKCETREVRRATAHPTRPTTRSASHTHIATTHDVSTQSRPSTSPSTLANEPGDTHDASSMSARMRPRTASPASQTPPATPLDLHMPPQRTIRPSAAENESKEGSGPCKNDMRDASTARGGGTPAVRTTIPHASHTRTATPRLVSEHASSNACTNAAANESSGLVEARTDGVTTTTTHTTPHLIPVPSVSRTSTETQHDELALPGNTRHPSATADEPQRRGEVCEDDTHAPCACPAAHAPRSAHCAPSSAPRTLMGPARNDTPSPTPGFEPGEPHMAAASFLKHVDPKLLEPAHIEEIVAIALREGHVEDEGLAAGKCTGVVDARAGAYREGYDAAKAESSPASFSWADDAESLPVHSMPPLPVPRDFSALRSSSRLPFGSLQRRARRSHRADLRPSRPTFVSAPVIAHHHHQAGRRAGQPSIMQVSSRCSSSAVQPLPLSWESDPRLIELSRVLESLGWVRESAG